MKQLTKTLGLSILYSGILTAANAAEIPMNTAQMQAMDKITGRVSVIEIPVNTEVKFGSFSIVVRECKTRPPEETPENFAFVDVVDVTSGKENMNIFKGWMISSSPALNAIEHPVYDVWLLKCYNSEQHNLKALSEDELRQRDYIQLLRPETKTTQSASGLEEINISGEPVTLLPFEIMEEADVQKAQSEVIPIGGQNKIEVENELSNPDDTTNPIHETENLGEIKSDNVGVEDNATISVENVAENIIENTEDQNFSPLLAPIDRSITFGEVEIVPNDQPIDIIPQNLEKNPLAEIDPAEEAVREIPTKQQALSVTNSSALETASPKNIEEQKVDDGEAVGTDNPLQKDDITPSKSNLTKSSTANSSAQKSELAAQVQAAQKADEEEKVTIDDPEEVDKYIVKESIEIRGLNNTVRVPNTIKYTNESYPLDEVPPANLNSSKPVAKPVVATEQKAESVPTQNHIVDEDAILQLERELTLEVLKD